MNKNIIKILTKIIKPFYGSGIGKYPPFFQLNNFYKKIAKNNGYIYITKLGFKIELDGSKFIDGEIIFNGIWEKNITNLLSKYLKKGDVFLDIGANIGYFSLLGSGIVGEKGKVLSFEPSSLNFEKLEKNIFINSLKNIKAFKLGVGNIEDEFNIFYDEKNPGATSLIKNQENKSFSKELIKIINLDKFLGKEIINFIKMDIEGYEYEAIIGMENILKHNDIKLVFEYSPRIYKNKEVDYKKYSIELLKTLERYGYSLYHIDNINGDISKINDYIKYFQKINSNKIGQSDIMCFKKK